MRVVDLVAIDLVIIDVVKGSQKICTPNETHLHVELCGNRAAFCLATIHSTRGNNLLDLRTDGLGTQFVITSFLLVL